MGNLASDKQHYLPKMYLKQWECEPNRLYVLKLNRKPGPRWDFVKTGDFCESRYYHSSKEIDDQLDKSIQQFGEIRNLLNSTVFGDTAISAIFSPNDIRILSEFVRVSTLRNPNSALTGLAYILNRYGCGHEKIPFDIQSDPLFSELLEKVKDANRRFKQYRRYVYQCDYQDVMPNYCLHLVETVMKSPQLRRYRRRRIYGIVEEMLLNQINSIDLSNHRILYSSSPLPTCDNPFIGDQSGASGILTPNHLLVPKGSQFDIEPQLLPNFWAFFSYSDYLISKSPLSEVETYQLEVNPIRPTKSFNQPQDKTGYYCITSKKHHNVGVIQHRSLQPSIRQ